LKFLFKVAFLFFFTFDSCFLGTSVVPVRLGPPFLYLYSPAMTYKPDAVPPAPAKCVVRIAAAQCPQLVLTGFLGKKLFLGALTFHLLCFSHVNHFRIRYISVGVFSA
jgi:hypothetical protein